MPLRGTYDDPYYLVHMTIKPINQVTEVHLPALTYAAFESLGTAMHHSVPQHCACITPLMILHLAVVLSRLR